MPYEEYIKDDRDRCVFPLVNPDNDCCHEARWTTCHSAETKVIFSLLLFSCFYTLCFVNLNYF